jgi:hypothetical protein
MDEPQRKSVWADAPPWAIELGIMVTQLEKTLMPLADDLNAAIGGLATGFNQLHELVQGEIDALTAALAAAGGGIPPDTTAAIQLAIANIQEITSKMATDASNMTASIPSAPTIPPPAPLPAPPVTPDVDVPQINPLRG